MSCERYRDALTELAVGGPATAGLQAHLDACEGCRRELAALREALGLADASLAEIVSAEPSPAFRARLRQRVAEEPLADERRTVVLGLAGHGRGDLRRGGSGSDVAWRRRRAKRHRGAGARARERHRADSGGAPSLG